MATKWDFTWIKNNMTTLREMSTMKKVAIASIIGVTSISAIFYFIKKKNSYCKSKVVADKESNTKSIDVSNGAKIYWNEYGDISDGFPILHFHGGLMCNLEGFLNDKVCKKYNFRLIVVDRPGCGQSILPSCCNNKITDLPSYYPMSSYMDDVKILLSHLNIKDNEYGVSGASHGGVFAMSSIYYLKPKFISLSVACMLAKEKYLKDNKLIIGEEYMNTNIDSGDFGYGLKWHIVRIIALYFKNLMIAGLRKQTEKEDKNCIISDKFVDDEVGLSGFELLWYTIFRSVEYGIKGVCYTAQLLNDNWGFDLDKDVDDEIKNKLKIFMFYGKNDAIINYKFATHYYNNYLIDECNFKNIQFNMYDDVGHFLNKEIGDQNWKEIRDFVDNNNTV